MNPPQLNFNALSNIERTIRANDKNMQSIAPRVNLNIDNRMNNSGNDRLSDDELGMDILANPKVTRRRSINSNVDLATPSNNFSNDIGNDIGNDNDFGNSNSFNSIPNISVNREDDIDLDAELESVHSHHSDQSQSNLHIHLSLIHI